MTKADAAHAVFGASLSAEGLMIAAITNPAAAKPTTCSVICASVKLEGKPYQFQSGTFTATPAIKPMMATKETRLTKEPREPRAMLTSTAASRELTQLVANSVPSCPPVIIAAGGI